MLTSMTGFGRALFDAPYGKLTVEIQTLNRKYLEVATHLPKEFNRFEPEVRKWVGEAISRGQVIVKVFLLPNLASVEAQLPDAALLKQLKKGWEKIAKKVGCDPKAIDLPFLLQFLPSGSDIKGASEKDLSALERVVREAVQSLVEMKRREGKALAKDLEGRLKELAKLMRAVESHAPDATKKMREKLWQRMEEFFKPGAESEERLLREVALFAERVDISEEITRFHSHLEQFSALLKKEAVGRKMDFLIQEMGREVNTIGSKSMEAKISHLVVEMKSELEKMREQVQNIE